MSSKWRALQHRHRYTYSSVVFPKSFIETLDLLSAETVASSDFVAQLREMTSLNSTYSQLTAAKNLSSSFAQLLATPEITDVAVSAAARLYLEILFLENSLPLHRTLISAFAKNRAFLPVIASCFAALCEEYSDPSRKGKKRFLASRAALSLMGYPKMGFLNETMEKCAALVAMGVARCLAGVVMDIDAGSRPSPVVMEQCQEAMSCLYYLLQKFPSKFVDSEGSDVFDSVVRTIVTVLKSSAFSRDCLVAAGVSFCAAAQACMSPGELSYFISRGFFGFSGDDGEFTSSSAEKMLPDVDLYQEIGDLGVLSKLCLLRGILTAIPRTVLNTCLVESRSGSLWAILYNGILPELCEYCENPIDSHFNFHALTVTQICLQQIKTSVLAQLVGFSGDYDPLPDDMLSRIQRIVWNNLEDPLSQTVKQVHLIFDLLLDINSYIRPGEENERTKSFLGKISDDLLHLGHRCKGRYVPLASITKRLGATRLLGLNTNILFEVTYAYVDDDVCCAATTFLKRFLECLRDECWSRDGIEGGYEAFRGHCLPPLLQGLVSGHSKLRSNLNMYALPVLFQVDVDSLFPMLAFISVGPSKYESKFNVDQKNNQCVAGLVSLLKVARSLALMEEDIEWDHDLVTQQKSSDCVAIVSIKGIHVRVPVEWFILAVTHVDDSIRIDAAEYLFLNPKTSSLPSSFELSLMREAIPLNMRCSSTAFQMKWTSLFRKFFSRVRTALERQVKQGSWKPVALSDGCGNALGVKDEAFRRAEELFCFMKWLSCFLFYSCYPSAPYERKTMAMELILIMMEIWPANPPQGNHELHPYSEGFTSPDSTLSLVGSIVDSWDRLRESSFRILLCFPTPLPGISSLDSLNEVIRWAKKLVCSPRVRESDAGALTLRLIFRKYVSELGWVVGVSDKVRRLESQSVLTNPIVEYLSSFIDWLRDVVEAGEKDLSEACRDSFVHGVLLALRYTFEDLDWTSEVILSNSSEMRCLLERLLELIMRVTALALWVVSADAWYMPYDMEDVVDDDDAFISEGAFEIDSPEESADKILKSEDSERPADHVVMVGCWLAMKEVSLLLGTIIRKIPLPNSVYLDPSKLNSSLTSADELEVVEMLNLHQLETIGTHFLQVLLKMKHNGAIDKTRAGFTALCNRLLCSNDPRLCRMTESWMEHLMERTIAKGQTVDDLLRRSAGIPAAFIALFLSEPEGTPKKLLPRALRWLIGVAMSLTDKCETKSEVITEKHENGGTSKIRDEGVIPTVHAFNVLRVAFNDTNLAADTSGFSAEAVTVAIRSFSSPYWEVRNSACLAYTALVRRMIGFLNVQKRESVRRALTGLEFFHRYPTLHSFLFNELKIATELLGDESSSQTKSGIANSIHPSLCPILILLSRLKPSIISSGTDDPFDPYLFMPFVRRCATQSNLRVRVLASRALTGLVSNENLQRIIIGVAHDLPRGQRQTPISKTFCLDSSTSINESNGTEKVITPYVSFNYIHGVLLQLSSLLDSNCRNLTDISKKDQILGELTQLFLKCSWIGSTMSCPCPTLNSSYLRVLDQMLNISRTYTATKHVSTIETLLLELAAECLDTGKSCGLSHDSTKDELQRQAAASYFSCLLGGNPEAPEEGFQLARIKSPTLGSGTMHNTSISVVGLQQRITSCIFNCTYEVRIATLKWLLHVVKSMKSGVNEGVIHTWAKADLQPTLVKLLALEENPKCIYYALKIIFSWKQIRELNELQCGETVCIGVDQDSVFFFWNRLVHLNDTVMRVKTWEIILCCMGICVKQFARILRISLAADPSMLVAVDSIRIDQSKGWLEAYEHIDSFVSLVKEHSASSEPVNMRKAAAEAMMTSGLLEEASSVAPFVFNSHTSSEELHALEIKGKEVTNLYASKILDLWFVCIQLLEDEDIGLRQRLAKDVQVCIESIGSNRGNCIDIVPAQVEKVIGSCFDFLSSTFGRWLVYLDYLSTWVFNAASIGSSKGDLVRQIFDKEIDNHHEEKLLICQICCSHLEKLCVPVYLEDDNENSIQIFSERCRLMFLRQLVSFLNYLETEGRQIWIGGIGNHKDVFISLYANLLGIYAFTQSVDKGGRPVGLVTDSDRKYLSEFAELVEIIRPFLRNPLISNLYCSVIQSHERLFGLKLAPVVGGECSLWSSFDPYFLHR